ncbi:MAG: glycosyltransferase family 39 protein [Tepidisphaeraceae bacterium]
MPAARGRTNFVWLALGAILVLAAGLRVYQIDRASFWLDEFFSVEVASGRGYWVLDVPFRVLTQPVWRSESDELATSAVLEAVQRSNHPPLYFLVLHVWMRVFGESDLTVRLLSVLFSLIAIVALFDALRTLAGAAPALWGALIMSLAGAQIEYAQEARGYMMLVALLLLSCAALVRIDRDGPGLQRLAVLFISGAAALLTHYLALPLLVAEVVYVLVRFRGATRRYACITLFAALGFAGVAWGPVATHQHGSPTDALAWLGDAGTGSASDNALARAARLPVRLFFNPISQPGAVVFLGAAIYVVPMLLLRRRPELLLWWLLLLTSVGGVAIGDVIKGTRALEYLRYTLPAAACVYALGALLCAPMGVWRHVVPATLALSCVLALPEAYTRWKPDWRTMARCIETRADPDDPIVFFKTDGEDWTAAALYLGISHYAPSFPRSAMFLAEPADTNDLAELARSGASTVWVVNGSSTYTAPQILPGCPRTYLEYFPFLGRVSRMHLPTRDEPHKPR